MNRVDRSETFARSGRSLVSDHPAHFVPPPVTTDLGFDDDDFVPKGLRVWAARTAYPFHVQGLVDEEGSTYVTCVLDGQYETLEFEPEQALDAFLHPFAHGFTLPL